MSMQSVDPRTGEPFGPTINDTNLADTEVLIAAATFAFDTWSRMSHVERAGFLESIADALDARKDELAELADRETALGIPRLTGEVGRTTFQMRAFATALRDPLFLAPSIDGAVDAPLPAGHPKFLRATKAIGVVAVFGANNFPFAFSVLGGDTVSALAAGCSVLIKSHPSHPQTSLLTFTIAQEALKNAGAPDSVIALGHGLDFGKATVTDARVSAAAFTGSQRGGRALFDLAQSRSRPIPFYGELGSINPVVALPSAIIDIQKFVAAYLDSLLLAGGQFCTNPSVLFVPTNSNFENEVAAQIKEREPQTFLSEATKKGHDAHRDILASSIRAKVLEGKAAPNVGFYSTSEVLVVAASKVSALDIFTTECFGPTGVIVTYENISEILGLLSGLDGALVGSLFANSSDEGVKEIIDALSRVCGRVAWNAWPTGVAVTVGQNHGGPYPASTSPLHTSVGIHAIERFRRPVTFQGFPDELMEIN